MIKKNFILMGLAAFAIWLAIGVVMIANQGCNSRFVSDTGRELPPGLGYAVQTMEASRTVYDTSLALAGELHCNKQISDETAWKIVKAANLYYLAHNAAQLAVDGWNRALEIRGDTESAKAATYIQLVALAQNAMNLTREIKTLTGKGIDLPDLLTADNIQLVFGVKS